MHKKGMTLVELMVAMSIFMIVMMLGIGGFVTISRSRVLVGNMRDSQQKLRVANEMIVRYAKQAEYVKMSPEGDSVEFYYDIEAVLPSKSMANKFVLDDSASSGKYNLIYSECSIVVGNKCTGEWNVSKASLLGNDTGGIYLSERNAFSLTGVLPTVLEVRLAVRNVVVGFESLSDTMTIENAIILESLK